MEQKLLEKLLGQIKKGTVNVTFWNETKRSFGHGVPKIDVAINSPGILKKALKSPSLAFGEAYMEGDIEVTSSLEDMIKLAEQNRVRLDGNGAARYLRGLHKNTKSKQADYIAHHYDLGNEFYKLWLDETMNYSCAYFHSPKDSLATAQHQKTTHILRKLQLHPGMKLLDIGSGWGYLLIEAAKKYKVKGTGVTLSREQLAFARARAKHEKVDHLVTFKYLNYQDIPKNDMFDRIVSVGFFEHVGKDNLDQYFKILDRHLKPEGISVLHSITNRRELPIDAWLDKYIFPGGYIPSMRETTQLIVEHGFTIFDYENLGQHYGMTLERWVRAFERNKKTVLGMYDERFYRMWRLYLISAMVSFMDGSNNLSQWVFRKGKNPAWPLTRDYLYKQP